MASATRRARFTPATRGVLTAAVSLSSGAAAMAGCTAILGIQEPADVAGGSVDGALPGNAPVNGQDSGAAGGDAAEGTDSSSGSTSDADASGCEAGAQQCSGAGAVRTCGSGGAWVGPWECATGNCTQGACSGSTPGTADPSCQDGGSGVQSCGSARESCCVSLEVPGGTYDRTYSSASDGGAMGATDPASVSGFRLDKYDVTVGRFRQYVNYLTVGGGAPPAGGAGKHVHLNGGLGLADGTNPGQFESGWDSADWDSNIPTGAGAVATWNANLVCDASYATWTPAPAGNESDPINCVTWFEAYAFCIWDGGFLPSEAEWEFASAGGRAQLEYPWGSAAPGTDSSYAIYDCDYPDASGTCSGASNIAPVGTAQLGAGTWGQLDLAGDVFQWTLDWYASSYLDPWVDDANLGSSATMTRTLRGGNFAEGTSVLLPEYRYEFDPADRYHGHGARCARSP